jgi:hypothetical protein
MVSLCPVLVSLLSSSRLSACYEDHALFHFYDSSLRAMILSLLNPRCSCTSPPLALSSLFSSALHSPPWRRFCRTVCLPLSIQVGHEPLDAELTDLPLPAAMPCLFSVRLCFRLPLFFAHSRTSWVHSRMPLHLAPRAMFASADLLLLSSLPLQLFSFPACCRSVALSQMHTIPASHFDRSAHVTVDPAELESVIMNELQSLPAK